jgi:hypothetical protein
MHDPQLGLFESQPGDANVQWLETLLRNAPGWQTAREIMAACLGRVNDREVRELASASQWIISGQRGYKHLEHATAEEAHHCCAGLESQAKKMGERAGRLRANAHKIFG